MAKKKSDKKPPLSRDETIIKEEFAAALHLARQNSGAFRHMDASALTKPIIQRRKAAVLACSEQARQRYALRYPHLEIGREWAKQNAVQTISADGADQMGHITLAAAIWMLDTLKAHYLLQDAYQYFSHSRQELDCVPLPDFFDPCHDETVIRAMVLLIRNRDEKTKRGNHFVTEASALRLPPSCRENDGIQELPPEHELSARERFDAVMAMIPPQVREDAEQRFEEKIWEFFDRSFACLSQCALAQTEADKEAEQLRRQLKELIGSGESSPRNAPFAKPFSIGADRFLQPGSSPARGKSPFSALELTTRIQESAETVYTLKKRRAALPYTAPVAPIMDPADLERDYDTHIASILGGLSVGDPYETCFAYLSLLDRGSDLPWLCTAASGVLLAAARKLPWFAPAEDAEEDSTVQLADLPAPAPLPLEDPGDKSAALYELKYSDAPLHFSVQPELSDWMVNLPQLVFGLTRTIMPRTVPTHDERVNELIAAGMDPGMASGMELYLRLAMEMQRFQRGEESDLLAERFHQLLESLGLDGPEEEVSDNVSTEELCQQLKKLKSQNDDLKKALYAATKEAEQVRSEAERSNEERASEQQELYDLRELVFRQTNEEEESESGQDASIRWPYTAKKRTVVFGGHETWLKAIRPLLPNVAFARSQNPNTDLIRNADIVWIQTNALSHKSFYKIINITRTYHIPVRYFGYASAQKCAVQLVQDDSTPG